MMRAAFLTPVLLLLAACGGEDAGIAQPEAHAACQSDIVVPRPGSTDGMIHIPGGTMLMGAKPIHGEEGPPTNVTVTAFYIDRTTVTNAQFAAFVEETGYVTVAERANSSIVFAGSGRIGQLDDPSQWWRLVEGASWRAPFGPGSTIEGRETYPVVHVGYADALAYAQWLGRDLPTEAEWEFAARGGIDGALYTWGNTPPDDATKRGNIWQGLFPVSDSGADGFAARLAPVGCFPANGFGLYDMAGNAWQWTKDLFVPNLSADAPPSPHEALASTIDPANPDAPRRVIKGGSFLCADNYCYRYRPAARTGAGEGDGASHIGFRTVLRVTEGGSP